jgi:hypothetical protein
MEWAGRHAHRGRPDVRRRRRALDRRFQDWIARRARTAKRFSIARWLATAHNSEQYAALVRRLDVRPIRLGLYHPLLRGWREWAFEG